MEYAEKLRLFLIFEKNRQKNSPLTKNNRQKNADFFAYTIYIIIILIYYIITIKYIDNEKMEFFHLRMILLHDSFL